MQNRFWAYLKQKFGWETARKGCKVYDMFGIPPSREKSHPMHGLYQFKTGFGGNLFHRMGCWDYPLDRELYRQFKSRELVGEGSYL